MNLSPPDEVSVSSEPTHPRLIAGKTEAPRLAGLEWMRVISCLGIIWFHLHAPGAAVGYGGLLVLSAVSVSLTGNPKNAGRLSDRIRTRADRLLVPWIVWSLIYCGMKALKCVSENRHWSEEFTPSLLFVGGSIHLWFLPYSFATNVIVLTMVYSRLPITAPYARVLWMALAAGSIPIADLIVDQSLRPPFAEFAFAAPSIFWGLACAQLPTGSVSRLSILTMLGVSCLIGCTIAVVMGTHQPSSPYIAAVVLLFLGWLLQASASSLLLAFSTLSFGIYLIHPLCDSLLRRIHRFHSPTHEALVVALVSGIATAFWKKYGQPRFKL